MLPDSSVGSIHRIQVNLKPWLLPGLLILATILRIYMLERDSLWVDELDQVLFGKGTLAQTLSSMTSPLDYLITHLIVHYVGQSEGVLRLPSVLWGVLSVLAIFYLGQYLFDKYTAYLAAFLLTIMPLAVEYSREVRYYCLPTLLILLSVYTCLRAIKINSRGTWLLYGSVILLAVFAHFYAVQVAFILGVWLILFKRPKRTALIAFVATTGLALLLFGIWFLSVRNIYLYSRQIYNNPIASEVLTAPFFDVTLGGAVLDPNATVDAIRAKLFSYLSAIRWTVGVYWTFVLSAVYLIIRRTAPRDFLSYLTLLLMLFLGGIVSAFAIDNVAQYFFAARQFLFFTPMGLLTIAAAYLYLARQTGNRLAKHVPRTWLSSGAVVLMACLSLWILWEPLTDLYKPSKQDWRGMSHYLNRQIGPEDLLLTPFEPYISFYAPELASQIPTTFPVDNIGMYRLAEAHPRIWIVLVHSSLYPRPPIVAEWIQDNQLLPLMFGHDLEVYSYSKIETF